MNFEVEVGQCSERGPRAEQGDRVVVVQPAHQGDAHGLLALVADGVSAGGRGAEAAHLLACSLAADYAATPATWDTTVALDRLIAAGNRWLADHNRRRRGLGELPVEAGGGTGLTTLTALVLRGQTWTVAHVGDCRAWRLRGELCEPLTVDHRLDHPDLRQGLTRAIGLDDVVRADFLQGELAIGDAFLLTCDGVHGVLPAARLARLAASGSAQDAAAAIVAAALQAGSRDNASAVVLRVRGLAPAALRDAEQRGRELPVPPVLRPGQSIDGLRVLALVADTGVHRLYRVEDPAGGGATPPRELLLKTLHESRASDPEERAMLAHEAWLGGQLTQRDARGFAATVARPGATAFYLLQEWVPGQTLQERLAQPPAMPVPDIVDGAIAVAEALGRLHRLGVVHRDIKPGNLHLGADGRWRILDLGVAVSGRESAQVRALHAGTPSYINPEQWQGQAADAGSDLYALGVTLYQWITGRLPYGDVEPYQMGRFRRDPVAPSRLRPDVPIWLDHLVLKAVAREPRQRFETAEELVLALRRGASRPLAAPGATPLLRRDPRFIWQLALGVSLLVNLLLVYWLLALPR
jgi:serine/threonine protein phosphatase PrpC